MDKILTHTPFDSLLIFKDSGLVDLVTNLRTYLPIMFFLPFDFLKEISTFVFVSVTHFSNCLTNDVSLVLVSTDSNTGTCPFG